MSFRISKPLGLGNTTPPWNQTFDTFDQALGALNTAQGWSSAYITGPFTLLGFTQTWNAYENQAAYDADILGLNAPKVIEL